MSAPAAPARARLPWSMLLLAAVLQTAATPPAWGTWAPLLVFPGLAAQFALATGERRPLLASYLAGALHVGAFSWSLRHILLPGWVAIALTGGLYWLLAAAATCALQRRTGGALAFGLSLAGSCWLRAEMPEIWYPHGQPCHDFWRWPDLLGAVELGGEPLANALLGAVAAASVIAWRSWRLGTPDWRRGRAQLAVAVAALLLPTIGGLFAGAPAEGGPTVAIAALEPGIHPTDAYASARSREQFVQLWQQHFAARWWRPTEQLAGPGAADAPALVLWPESSAMPDDVIELDGRGEPRGELLSLPAIELHRDTRLCLGAGVRHAGASRDTPAAVLVDEHGRHLAHHEKRRLVPAGEFLPLLALLPAFVADAIRAAITRVMGMDWEVEPGRLLPPLQTAAGVPFGALMCYDNAFPSTVADQVAAGARFLVVLSNEAWYRGGGELDQLAAITVLRARATHTPIVRCTTDGRTMAVDARGRILAALEQVTAPAPAARILRVDLPLGTGRLPPMATLHPWLGWGAAALVLAACAHRAWGRARLRWLRRTPAGGAEGGPRPDLSAGS
jgi:apolipoprotein N-acyltransferase